LFDGVNYRYAFGAAAADYIRRIHKHNEDKAEAPIKGQVANRGSKQYVEGKARLIKVDYSDLAAVSKAISAMRKGEILVAEFTAPELVLACEKAAAIITDLGGMLSHAAIVSRELRIPCIVGTDHASHEIQTGDTVILNMDTGEVEIKK